MGESVDVVVRSAEGGVVTLASTASHSQEAIGNATAVILQAEGTHGGNTRTLAGSSPVYSSESIPTGDTGVADLRFHDDSKLSVGRPGSSASHALNLTASEMFCDQCHAICLTPP